MITNTQSGTNIHEIARGIFRINTPVALPGGVGQFNFNQYLIVDDAPMVFHTGPRQMFPLVSEAIASVMPLERLRYIGFSHFEADECGALNSFLAAAPRCRTRLWPDWRAGLNRRLRRSRAAGAVGWRGSRARFSQVAVV